MQSPMPNTPSVSFTSEKSLSSPSSMTSPAHASTPKGSSSAPTSARTSPAWSQPSPNNSSSSTTPSKARAAQKLPTWVPTRVLKSDTTRFSDEARREAKSSGEPSSSSSSFSNMSALVGGSCPSSDSDNQSSGRHAVSSDGEPRLPWAVKRSPPDQRKKPVFDLHSCRPDLLLPDRGSRSRGRSSGNSSGHSSGEQRHTVRFGMSFANRHINEIQIFTAI